MVSAFSIACIIVSIVICFGLPIGGILYLALTKKRVIKAVLVGAGVFIVFQMITRIPILTSVLPPMAWYQQMAKNPWIYGIFLGLTAGLFEEIGRFVGYKTLLKGRTRFVDGVAFGIGHGGIEAILLVGLANINNLVFALSINSGAYEKIAAALPRETADFIHSQLTSLPPAMFLIGGMERIFAMTIQIALSLLVLYAVAQRKTRYLVLAVLLHTVIDAPAIILPAVFKFDIYKLEAFIAVIFAISLIFIFWSRKRMFRNDVEVQPEGAQ